MENELRLTKAIHYFVRGGLNWRESIELLDEIIESDKWLQYLDMEMLLYDIAASQSLPLQSNS